MLKCINDGLMTENIPEETIIQGKKEYYKTPKRKRILKNQ